MKRTLLEQLGRGTEALDSAWADFKGYPSKFKYDELMKFVPKKERASWHEKAMDAAAAKSDFASLIELWLEMKELDRLVARLRSAKDAELEGVSHYRTEPLAKRLSKSHPDLAARVYRALAFRILNAKKSRYYDAAIGNMEDAKKCYAKAGRLDEWQRVVAQVRREHSRKLGFMDDFERLVTGEGPSSEPTFIERARSRWEGQRQS